MAIIDNDCENACPQDCEWVFGRVRVRPTHRFGTWVEWLIHPQFDDAEPYTFQLQVGKTGLNTATDWEDVGLSAVNVTYLTDDEQRDYGKTPFTHYRIKLTTSVGTYYSAPISVWGDVPFKYWRLIKNRERMWRVQLERTLRGQEGYLLKRKLTGVRPELGEGVLDYMTGEIVNPQAEETVGTEFIGGYYAPVPCVFVDLDGVTRREHLDDGKTRGTINDGFKARATLLAVPQIDSYDVWVDLTSDFRWEIHEIKVEEDLGLPIIVSAEFRLLPFTHPVYAVEIAGQSLVEGS